MTVGEVVEILIRIHDCADLSMHEDDAVCAACNILDLLPNMMDVDEAKDMLVKGKEAKGN